MRSSLALLLTILACVGGCTGLLETPAPLRPTDPTETAYDCASADLFEQPLRPLSMGEYVATVGDLVGPVQLRSPSLSPAEPGTLDGDVHRASVDADLIEAYFDDASRVAEAALGAEVAPGFDGCALEAEVTRGCARGFLAAFGRRAWRRPLEEAELDELLATWDAARATESGREALHDAISAALLSADFLYRVELGVGEAEVRELTPFEVASRLSFLLVGRAPSDALLDATEAGELDDRAGRLAWADRLLYDEGGAVRPEARQRIRGFVLQWLGADALDEVTLPADAPEGLRERLRAETEAFVDEVVFERGGGVEMLLDGGFAMLDRELADHYGVEGVSSSELTPVEDPLRRGILQQGTFLGATWAGETTSLHRGAWVLKQISCFELGDPPPAAQMAEIPDVDGPARDRLAFTTEEAACATCHDAMNPLGFALENFDATGRWRELDDGHPIDARVEVPWLTDAAIEGSVGLGSELAASEDVQRCGSGWTLRFIRGVPPGRGPRDVCAVERLRESGDGIVERIYRFIESDDFARVRPPSGE